MDLTAKMICREALMLFASGRDNSGEMYNGQIHVDFIVDELNCSIEDFSLRYLNSSIGCLRRQLDGKKLSSDFLILPEGIDAWNDSCNGIVMRVLVDSMEHIAQVKFALNGELTTPEKCKGYMVRIDIHG